MNHKDNSSVVIITGLVLFLMLAWLSHSIAQVNQSLDRFNQSLDRLNAVQSR